MSELSDKQVYMYKQKYLSRGSRNPPKVWNGEGGGEENDARLRIILLTGRTL